MMRLGNLRSEARVALLVVLFGLLASCGGSGAASNAESATDAGTSGTQPATSAGSDQGSEADDGVETVSDLVVYYGLPREMMAPLFEGFAEAYPDIQVLEFRQPTEELMTTLELEVRAGRARPDVVIGSGASLAAIDVEYDAFQEYTPSNADELLEAALDPAGTFVSMGLQPYVIAYNTDRLSDSDVPRSFADLLEPRFKNQLIVGDPRSSGGVHNFIWFITEYLGEDPYGWRYFENLGALDPELTGSHGTIADRLATGERIAAPQVLSLTLEGFQAGEPVMWVFPEEGVPTYSNGMAILKDAANVSGAGLFIDYVVSQEGQAHVADIGLVPVRDDVGYTFPDGSTLDGIDFIPVDTAYIAQNVEEQTDRFHEALEAGAG